jgi:glucosamine--fructose-6-phosphate aminotransferase (isomerizing)
MAAENLRGVHTLSEIRSQPDAWERVFRRIDQGKELFSDLLRRAEDILCIGCGSAFNVSYAVAPLLQQLCGKTCRPVHASDLIIYPSLYLKGSRNALIIAFSRSGDTTESARAVETARRNGVSVLSVVCFGESRMALHSDALPRIARERMPYLEELGKRIGRDREIQKFAFLGNGSYYGLAREAQLKIKEMVLLPADSYVTLDFQHGPMSNVGPHMLVTLLVSDAGREYDLAVARNMKKLGGKLFVLCERARDGFKECADYLLELESGLGDGIRNVLYMPSLQFMAYERSLLEQQNPDEPKNLFYYMDLEKDL